MTERPLIGSKWQHRNGNIYVVWEYANDSEHPRENYPLTIIYKGANGKIWARPLHDWHRSMKPWTVT